MKKPELLSPAGSFESLKAAVSNGCDAVYFGASGFNARNSAENIKEDKLKEAIDYCHGRGVKCYITFNTLYRKEEFKELMKTAEKIYSFGADAFIVSDMGFIGVLNRFFDIPLHASTQMSAHSLEDVKYLESIGFDHINIARELSIESIKHITASTEAEIECFAHGALCVCYSGRCLMSSFFGGRSGNRGQCAQPCRLDYRLKKDNTEIAKGAMLSPKDLMTLPMLGQLMEAGVSTLKIEGRMRTPEYTAITTQAYRRAIDAIISGEKIESAEKDLLQIFNRGGSFTSGYLADAKGTDMITLESSKSTGRKIGEVLSYNKATGLCTILLEEELFPGDGIEIYKKNVGTGINKNYSFGIIKVKLSGDIDKGDQVYKSYDKSLGDRATKTYEKDNARLKLKGRITAKTGAPLKLTVYRGNVSVSMEGATVMEAEKAALTPDELAGRMKKTGDTSFILDIEGIDADNNIFIPIKEINSLRRAVLEAFNEKYISSFEREIPKYKWDTPMIKPDKKKLTVLVSDKAQFMAAVKAKPYLIYVEGTADNSTEKQFYIDNKGTSLLYFALPHINTDSIDELISVLEESAIDGYLVRTLGQLYILAETAKGISLDYTLNTFNPSSVQALNEYDIKTLSPELSIEDLKHFGAGCECIIHGRMPLMITEQCPIGNFAAGEKSGKYCNLRNHGDNYVLVDRKNLAMPLKCDCSSCIAVIYNFATTYTLNKAGDMARLNTEYLRLQFTDENPDAVYHLTAGYINKVIKNIQDDKQIMDMYVPEDITNGHFYRGAK